MPAARASAAPAPRAIAAILLLTAVVGIVVSLASWAFLELIYQLTQGVYDDLPKALGYDDGAPVWWPLPVLGLAGVAVAFAIARLPGTGGHNPAQGLAMSSTQPVELPGVILAALATIAFGLVLGPEAPLIALGSALGLFAVRLARKDAPEQLGALVAAAGTLRGDLLHLRLAADRRGDPDRAAALDRRGLQTVVPVGLLAAGVGSMVSIGMGSWTGLSSKDYALVPPTLPQFARPDAADIAWTIPLAAVVAVGLHRDLQGGAGDPARAVAPAVRDARVVGPRHRGPRDRVRRGHRQVGVGGALLGPGRAAGPRLERGTWSAGALALVLICKGLAWSLSLAAYRGGPTFPGLFLGAAAGLLASHLPGLELTPAVGVAMGAAMVAVLQLPLSAVVLATLLTAQTGGGAEPLIILGVVAAFVTTKALTAAARPRPLRTTPRRLRRRRRSSRRAEQPRGELRERRGVHELDEQRRPAGPARGVVEGARPYVLDQHGRHGGARIERGAERLERVRRHHRAAVERPLRRALARGGIEAELQQRLGEPAPRRPLEGDRGQPTLAVALDEHDLEHAQRAARLDALQRSDELALERGVRAERVDEQLGGRGHVPTLTAAGPGRLPPKG